MKNKRLCLFCALIIAVIGFGCYVWNALCCLKTDGLRVIVDGSRLRLSNLEISVTNSVFINVRPTQKTSEWIYVHGVEAKICINGHWLEVRENSIKHICDASNKDVGKEIKSEMPVLIRFFNDKVVIAGAATWASGKIEIENANNSYDVEFRVKKDCKIIVKGNWYEFTG